MIASYFSLQRLPRRSLPIIGDRLDRRCLITSAALHGSTIIIIMGWHVMLSWIPAAIDDPPEAEPAPSITTEIVYAASTPPSEAEVELPGLSDATSEGPLSDPLRPRLDHSHHAGSGDGNKRDHGIAIDLPELPAQQALPDISSDPADGGGRQNLPQQLRREQEANYLLMGFLLRQYQREWRAIFGHQLARGPIRLWIEHDNSRVTSARFARGSSTGIPALDQRIIAWLVAENEIDLSDLRGSERRLLMSVDLYQAHR